MVKAREHELIRLAAAGDKGAAAALIKAHQQSLFGYIMRMSGRVEISEDIVQEAFVRVLMNLHRFDERYRFSTWLFTIAKRLYVNACQKHAPTFDSEIVNGWQGSSDKSDRATINQEVQSNARDALGQSLLALPEHQREILILFHQQDWPIALIAEHMSMPEGTIKSHLHRGRRRLRDLLEAHEKLSAHVAEVWA